MKREFYSRQDGYYIPVRTKQSVRQFVTTKRARVSFRAWRFDFTTDSRCQVVDDEGSRILSYPESARALGGAQQYCCTTVLQYYCSTVYLSVAA